MNMSNCVDICDFAEKTVTNPVLIRLLILRGIWSALFPARQESFRSYNHFIILLLMSWIES